MSLKSAISKVRDDWKMTTREMKSRMVLLLIGLTIVLVTLAFMISPLVFPLAFGALLIAAASQDQ